MSGGNPVPAAVVYGCAGLELTADEEALFRACNPVGYILFDRNINTPEQVRRLTNRFREISGNDDILVLIDQEGGRVQRLRPPHWPSYPPAGRFGQLGREETGEAAACVALNYRLIASDLAPLGINVDCAPVLDLSVVDSHKIIGNRAFSEDPMVVARLGQAVCDGLLEGGVLPVVKHIPGHGRAVADSHLELPRVDTALDTLMKTDFAPFIDLSDAPAGMTAHIVYSSIDPQRPGSTSPTLVRKTIRDEIGFDGLLFSDDVCMNALSGSAGDRVRLVLNAGCDVALHCNPNFADMAAIAETCPPMRDDSLLRLKSAVARLNDSDDFDRDAAKRRISGFLGGP